MTQARKHERYGLQLPPLVQEAIALAEELGFPLMPEGRPVGYEGPPSACIPEVGRLLRALAASLPGGRIGELGTGAAPGSPYAEHAPTPARRLRQPPAPRATEEDIGKLDVRTVA